MLEASPSPKHETVPTPAVRRLSLYLRELEMFLTQDRKTISSQQLGKALGLTDAQVRKDLAYFGQFGHPGIGYQVDELVVRIRGILGTDKIWSALLIGVGNIGRALLSYKGFAKRGFQIVAVFDNNPKKIGQPIALSPPQEILPVDRMAAVMAERDIELAIVAVPTDEAQSVMNTLVAAGIKGILNFAPTSVSVPDHVPLYSVDLAIRMEQLAFQISTKQIASEK